MNTPQDPMELCEQDRRDKLALQKQEEERIQGKLQEFGLESIDELKKHLPEMTPSMEKGILFSHKDFQVIAGAIKDRKPWAVVSGINPSGPLHLGHLALFKENRALQKLGAEIFMPISEDESFVFDKAPSLREARANAYKYVIPSLMALGFDPEKTHIFLGSDYPTIYTFAIHISKHFSLNQIKGVFGFTDDINAGVVFYMGGVQMAHILLPQLEEFGGPRPTVVPVGIDQHPYIQVARRFARRVGMVPPARINLKFLPGLGGRHHPLPYTRGRRCGSPQAEVHGRRTDVQGLQEDCNGWGRRGSPGAPGSHEDHAGERRALFSQEAASFPCPIGRGKTICGRTGTFL